jgi:hypothetical protein
MTRKKAKRLNVRLDGRHYAFLKAYAEQEGLSVADIIRRWIERQMAREEVLQEQEQVPTRQLKASRSCST